MLILNSEMKLVCVRNSGVEVFRHTLIDPLDTPSGLDSANKVLLLFGKVVCFHSILGRWESISCLCGHLLGC